MLHKAHELEVQPSIHFATRRPHNHTCGISVPALLMYVQETCMGTRQLCTQAANCPVQLNACLPLGHVAAPDNSHALTTL